MMLLLIMNKKSATYPRDTMTTRKPAFYIQTGMMVKSSCAAGQWLVMSSLYHDNGISGYDCKRRGKVEFIPNAAISGIVSKCSDIGTTGPVIAPYDNRAFSYLNKQLDITLGR